MNVPSSDEHVQVLSTSLYTDTDQHNDGSDPDSDLPSEAIGKVRSKRICSQGTDVLTNTRMLETDMNVDQARIDLT